MRSLAGAAARSEAAFTGLAEDSLWPWWLVCSALLTLSVGLALTWLRLRRALAQSQRLSGELGHERRACAALRDSEVALQAGLAGLGQVLLVIDVDGTVRYATPNSAMALGLDVAAVRGKAIGALFGQDVQARLRSGQGLTNLCVALERPDGVRVVRLDARTSPALGPAWVCACRDVTAEIEQERLAQAKRHAAADALHLASLGALVSSLAHEISNPNHAITLNVQVLRSAWQGVIPLLDEHQRQRGEFKIANFPYTDMREEVLRMVDAIYQGADRIRAIVTGLRDYARDYGRRQMATLDAAALLEEVVASTLVYRPELRGRLRLSVAPALPAVRGNANLLAHALLDLLLIAADGGGEDGRELAVDGQSAPGPRLVLQIHGLGPPQQAKELARLAQVFQAGGEDVGLKNWRLALSSWIVQQHQGELHAEPCEHQRAMWRISLPGIEREPRRE